MIPRIVPAMKSIAPLAHDIRRPDDAPDTEADTADTLSGHVGALKIKHLPLARLVLIA